MDHLHELLGHNDYDRTVSADAMRHTPPEPTEPRTVIGVDHDPGTARFTIVQARLTADFTEAGRAFHRVVVALLPLTPLLHKIGKLLSRRPAAPRRTGRTYRRIVRTPAPPRHRPAPAAPSALTAAYTRRYRNRQGRR